LGFFRRHAGKFAASAAITFGIVFAVHKGGLKFLPEGGDFQHVRWWTLPVYFVTWLGMTWFRSVRWRYLLRSIAEVPRSRLFAVSCVGFAAILLMPFRIGEIVRPYMIRTPAIRRQSGRPITLTAATSSVIAERIIDGLYLSVVLALALFFVPTIHPLPDHVVGLPVSVARVRMSGYGMLFLFGTLFGTIAVFYFARSWAHRTTLAVIGKVSMKLAEKLAAIFEKCVDGLHVFGRADDALGFFVETTCYWALNVLGMWLLAWGCGVVHGDGSSPGFGEACALMGMLGCTVLIPGPPGLLGVFQLGVYAGMTMFYPTEVVTKAGAAYVFLLYACQGVFTVAAGALGLAFEWQGLQALEQTSGILSETAGAAE
jgi:glycosyltransferase 2 family protein